MAHAASGCTCLTSGTTAATSRTISRNYTCSPGTATAALAAARADARTGTAAAIATAATGARPVVTIVPTGVTAIRAVTATRSIAANSIDIALAEEEE
jgi:hypothetical protein